MGLNFTSSQQGDRFMNMTIAAIVISALVEILVVIWQVQSLAKMIQQDTHKRLDDLKKHFDERLDRV
jgi:ABC-type transport system involved in cytochrome bd biosynthesis fused ATPase/permease subunit